MAQTCRFLACLRPWLLIPLPVDAEGCIHLDRLRRDVCATHETCLRQIADVKKQRLRQPAHPLR